MKKNIQTFLGFQNKYKKSKAVLFGAGFDSTTSFKSGAKFAPQAMREDSWSLESYSPYQDKDLDDIKLFDSGDLELPYGNTKKTLKIIEQTTSKIIKENKKPIMIGGEHLVTLGAIQALSKKYHDLHIIHFDAHADLRNSFLGEKLSHATVLKRIYDIVGDNKIYQFCIRSGTKQEFKWANKHTILEKFTASTLEERVKDLTHTNIYITIDLDVLDPSIFSGTGTVEPGGISFDYLINCIKIMSQLQNVVGFDIVELSPHYDQSGVSTSVACKVLRELAISVV
ncbi:Agmatinase [hydrothermal vent metagenome]|uniref:Agmatinase n=1 Tax=hydrothermal vent metagenome TaxID=652676 RepID=A0A3B1E6W9_9ZZZZ